jgi:hypothetical protein
MPPAPLAGADLRAGALGEDPDRVGEADDAGVAAGAQELEGAGDARAMLSAPGPSIGETTKRRVSMTSPAGR